MLAATLGLALTLGACAVSSPLAVTSTGAGLSRAAKVALAQPDDVASLNGRFATAIAAALRAKDIVLADDATQIADIAISQNAATSGIIRGEGEATATLEAQDWIASPREKRRLDECEAQRLRATLVIYNRSSGSVAYRGSGEATECDFGDDDLAQFAKALVADALGSRAP